jgi:hypothetical protein
MAGQAVDLGQIFQLSGAATGPRTYSKSDNALKKLSHAIDNQH